MTTKLTPMQRVERYIAKDTNQSAYQLAVEFAQELERVQEELAKRDNIGGLICIHHNDKERFELFNSCPFCKLEQLRSENAELRKDKERLDWLELQQEAEININRNNVKPFEVNLVGLDGCCYFSIEKVTIRTAIDAAITQQKGTKQ